MPRGIRPMYSNPARPPTEGISLDEPLPPPRQRRSPVESSPDSPAAHSLMERVRRTGIITDAEDRHILTEAQQIIDNLLFKLKQAEDEKGRLTNKVYDLMKRQNLKTH
jgi:hypothetical protein